MTYCGVCACRLRSSSTPLPTKGCRTSLCTTCRCVLVPPPPPGCRRAVPARPFAVVCAPPSLPRRPGAPACKRLFFLLFLARSLDANERVPWNCHAAVFLIPMPAATLLSLFVVRVPCVAAIVRLRRPRSWIHRRHSWVRRHPESGVPAQAADRQIPGARRHHLLHLLWAGALRVLACRPARPSCTAPTKRQRPEACQRRIAAGTSVCTSDH